MSKRDRANRFTDVPDFKDDSAVGMEKKAVSPEPLKTASVVVKKNDEEDEEEGLFQRIGTFFGGCWSTLAAYSVKFVSALFVTFPKAVVSKPWRWCRSSAQWTWNLLRKIPACCVIRWDSDENDEEQPQKLVKAKVLETKSTGINVAAPPAIKQEIAKPGIKTDHKVNVAAAIDQFDEDESASSRWWGIAIKSSAAAAVLLILAGGYFAVTSFFPPTASDTETVALTDQTLPAETPAISSPNVPEQPIVEPASVPASVSPMNADTPQPLTQSQPPMQSLAFPGASASSEPPQQADADSVPPSTLDPPQGSPLDQDPFFAAPDPSAVPANPASATPALAHTESAFPAAAPMIAEDPFASAMPAIPTESAAPMPPTSMPPAPPLGTESAVPAVDPLDQMAESTPPPAVQPSAAQPAAAQSMAALQPLTALEPSSAPQLQPLVALDSSPLPTSTGLTGTAPAAVESSANAPIAAKFRERRANRRNDGNPSFDQAPSPPAVVSTIPQTAAVPAALSTTRPMAEPVKEIVPQIPHTGTVEAVPLPAVSPLAASVPETAPVQPMHTEPSPAIPKDVFLQTADAAVSPAGKPEITKESVAQFLPMDEPPIDRQLRELHQDAEIEPAKLRFNASAPVREPALRFTPRQGAANSADTIAAASEQNLLYESVNEFQDVMSANTSVAGGPNTDGSNTNSIALTLPVLENAPAPVFAEIRPAYREGGASGEQGMTFQKRIDSAIKRSPTEMEVYTIQQGDTYMTISDRFYGTSLLYALLAAHNQKSGIGWRPTEGVVIEIPTADYLQTHYGSVVERQERRLAARRSAIRYIVQEGDTIFRLATDKLQDSTRWKEIYVLNTDRIKDVRDLEPGMEILLPVDTTHLTGRAH